ncbi:MAG: nuclear transport factor 2 family protein [Vicinamibacterales bacterium]|nr:nuclear transport factor 2 family protein [Vicinamibacterales bacterium]
MPSKFAHFFAGALVVAIASYTTHLLDAKPRVMQGTHVNLSPEDYIEILQLQSEYPRDVDPGSVRDASWMFTKDARSVISGAPMVKPADFKHFYGGLVAEHGQASKGGNRHFNMSPIIVGLPDGTVRGSSLMMGISIKEKGGKPTIDLMGKYEDVYVRTPDGWRMKQRLWRADSHVGSYQKVAPSPVLAIPSTWKTEQEDVIQDLWSKGMTRDETGAPIPSAGAPAAPAATGAPAQAPSR